MKREHVWLGFMTIGPLTAFSAMYNPALSIVAIILIMIGLKGVMYDIL